MPGTAVVDIRNPWTDCLQDLRFAIRLLWKDRGFAITTDRHAGAVPGGQHRDLRRRRRGAAEAAAVCRAGRLVAHLQQVSGRGRRDRRQRRARLLRSPARHARRSKTIAMYRRAGVTLGGSGLRRGRARPGMLVTPSFFRVLARPAAARPALHRRAGRDRAREGRRPDATASGSGCFGGRDDAVGQDLRLGGVPYAIVGVLPPGLPLHRS